MNTLCSNCGDKYAKTQHGFCMSCDVKKDDEQAFQRAAPEIAATKKMKIDLLGDKVLLRPQDRETVTDGGIVLTGDAVPEGVQYAEVMYVGVGLRDGDTFTTPIVKVGQTVVHNIAQPLTMEVNGEDLHLLAESSIIGVIH